MSPSTSPPDFEAERSEHLRTQFLRRVAHDIASPTGVALTVLDELVKADKPRPELVAMARRSLRRLMRLSDHLAIVAELEAGGLQPELDALDLRALTKQAIDEALAIDGRKGIAAASTLPPRSLIITGDARLLLFLFREVIGNALKLATSRVEIAVEAGEDMVSLRVEDDGAGFSEEAAATLGLRFLKRSGARGLGLSLSVGLEILRAHGGSLVVQPSTLPRGRRGTAGAAVVVTLPSRSTDARLEAR